MLSIVNFIIKLVSSIFYNSDLALFFKLYISDSLLSSAYSNLSNNLAFFVANMSFQRFLITLYLLLS
jgi:hypothetical protein